jgi:hypothetical protein
MVLYILIFKFLERSMEERRQMTDELNRATAGPRDKRWGRRCAARGGAPLYTVCL